MARPPASSTLAPKKNLSLAEMQRGIDRLTERLQELNNFNFGLVRSDANPPELTGLEASIERTISRIFGENTPDYERYKAAAQVKAVFHAATTGYPAMQHYREQITSRIQNSKHLLQEAIRGLQEDVADQEAMSEPVDPPYAIAKTALSQTGSGHPGNKVFLVHGRDDATKNEVALFLRTIGLDPIILHLLANGGRHLLTKFREEAEGAAFAVVLMTPDDEGNIAGASDRQPRARQNVVFELGFFIGKLGSASVAALLKGDVEKPSDFDGIAYIPFDAGSRWKTDLARELHHAKVPFDPAKAFTA
jgi:predicted nucleotide-binding protein